MKNMNYLKLYFERRMLRIFLLGIMSGFPWVLIGSALSLWLKENDLSRSTIGWASLIFGVYAINFLWAPFIDKLYIPFFKQKNWSQEILDYNNASYHSMLFSNMEFFGAK